MPALRSRAGEAKQLPAQPLSKAIGGWHYGRISVASRVGEGRSFTIKLLRAKYRRANPELALVGVRVQVGARVGND